MDSSLGQRPATPRQPGYCPPGLLTLFEAYLAVGKSHYGDDWTGHEFGALGSSTVNDRRRKLEESLASAQHSLAALDNPNSPSARRARKNARRLEGNIGIQSLIRGHVKEWTSDDYIETLKKPERETIALAKNALATLLVADDEAFERHQVSWKRLRDHLCEGGLWAGVMSTGFSPPHLNPNSDGISSLPLQFWWSDEAEAVLESGRTVAKLAGESREGWVMVRKDDLSELLAGENRTGRTDKTLNSGLSLEARKRGGEARRDRRGLRDALDRIRKMNDGQLTVGILKRWFQEEEITSHHPYLFDPPIDDCDEIFLDGDTFYWKDRKGASQKLKLPSLRRYFSRRIDPT